MENTIAANVARYLSSNGQLTKTSVAYRSPSAKRSYQEREGLPDLGEPPSRFAVTPFETTRIAFSILDAGILLLTFGVCTVRTRFAAFVMSYLLDRIVAAPRD